MAIEVESAGRPIAPRAITSVEPATRKRRTPNRRNWMRHLLLLAGAVVALYPLGWMISASFKPTDLIFGRISLWAEEWRPSNYTEGWSALPTTTFATFFRNSFIISASAVVGNVISCSMAAYAFARLRFPGRGILFSITLLTIMLPFHVLVIPQYILFERIGWINTFYPLIVPKLLATDGFFIFLMVQFIRGIPPELDDAARVDGCGRFRIYRYVILPLARPALVTTAIFTFIWTWNDFFSHTIYLQSIDRYTLPLGLRLFLDSTGVSSFGPMFAMGVLSLAPALVLFLLFQRLLIEGIATSGLKG
jgi:multiple sugar transport system permease protein